jgi:hypothetical protein
MVGKKRKNKLVKPIGVKSKDSFSESADLVDDNKNREIIFHNTFDDKTRFYKNELWNDIVIELNNLGFNLKGKIKDKNLNKMDMFWRSCICGIVTIKSAKFKREKTVIELKFRISMEDHSDHHAIGEPNVVTSHGMIIEINELNILGINIKWSKYNEMRDNAFAKIKEFLDDKRELIIPKEMKYLKLDELDIVEKCRKFLIKNIVKEINEISIEDLRNSTSDYPKDFDKIPEDDYHRFPDSVYDRMREIISDFNRSFNLFQSFNKKFNKEYGTNFSIESDFDIL